MKTLSEFMVDWEKKGLPVKNKFISLKSTKKIKKIAKNSSISLNPSDTSQLKITCMGNSYINPAYLWRTSDILDKIIEPTFARAVYQIQSGIYPNFIFSINSARFYEMINESYPELFNNIQNLVNENLWELIGGELMESDLLVPNGESIIRQRLYGQRFYIKNFYKTAKISWFNNTPFFNRSLPQILRKSGSKFIFLNNLGSNSAFTIKNYPILHFKWESPDGSQILATWSKISEKLDELTRNFVDICRIIDPDKDPSLNSKMTIKEANLRLSNEHIPLLLKPYGGVDKKLGVDPLKIVEKMIWEEMGYIQNQTAEKFFEKLRTFEEKLPTWKDDIIFENLSALQESLTSISMIKENNSTGEILLYQSEVLSVISGLMGATHFQDELTLDWKKLLLLQANKILEGKSICEVYRDAAKEYNSVFNHLASSQEYSLMSIAHTLKKTLKNDYYSVFNPFCWARGDYFTILGKNYNHAFDEEGAPLLVQKVAFSSYCDNREINLGMSPVSGTNYLKNMNKLAEDLAEIDIVINKGDEQENLAVYESKPKKNLLIFLPSNQKIGSFGISNISFLKSPPKPQKYAQLLTEDEENFIFSNRWYTVKISKVDGRITHVSSKLTDPNILNEEGIGYRLYQGEKVESKENLIPFPELNEIKIEESGPLRYTILVKYKPTKDNSELHTRISFYHESPIIYGETLVEWSEKSKILKLNIGTQIKSSKITLGTQLYIENKDIIIDNMGNMERNSFSFQKFVNWEDRNLKFGDFIGVAFYSQIKYCLSLQNENKEISFLNSIKTPKADKSLALIDEDFEYRNKYNDRGFYRIPWALEFYSDSINNMDILKHATEYNMPLILAPTNAVHESISFFQIEQSNVIITTIKETEEFIRDAPDWFYNPGMAELAFIIRCVEYEGKNTNCSIKINQILNIKKVIEVDLLERIKENGIISSDVEFSEGHINFSIGSHEIKSILVIGRIPLEED
ncbi:MAG: glycoside hydrolase family 38 C-terminal domain-containing protein [Promethearchaeota archaeon]